MNANMKRTLQSTLALMVFAVVAVTILTLADAFFPKYIPTLDQATLAILEKLAPSGAADSESAFSNYEMVIPGDLDAWNEANGFSGGMVKAVYRAIGGDASGTWFIETSTIGFKGGEILLITAIAPDGTLCKILPRRIYDSYYRESDLNDLNAFFAASPMRASDLTASAVKPFIYNAGATYTTNGLANGVQLSAKMFAALMQGEAAQ